MEKLDLKNIFKTKNAPNFIKIVDMSEWFESLVERLDSVRKKWETKIKRKYKRKTKGYGGELYKYQYINSSSKIKIYDGEIIEEIMEINFLEIRKNLSLQIGEGAYKVANRKNKENLI